MLYNILLYHMSH